MKVLLGLLRIIVLDLFHVVDNWHKGDFDNSCRYRWTKSPKTVFNTDQKVVLLKSTHWDSLHFSSVQNANQDCAFFATVQKSIDVSIESRKIVAFIL